ncbi:MAG: hypothetical protein AAGA90_15690 [Actinomycetota bacterium]
MPEHIHITEAKQIASEIREATRGLPSHVRLCAATLAHLVLYTQRRTIDDTNAQLLAESGLKATYGGHRAALNTAFDTLVARGLIARQKRKAPPGERGTFFRTTFLSAAERSLPASEAANSLPLDQAEEEPLPGSEADHCPVSPHIAALPTGSTLGTSLDTPKSARQRFDQIREANGLARSHDTRSAS